MHRVCAVVPAYNEEASIASVIRRIKKTNIDIIVIDDGSRDKTPDNAEKEGIQLIRHVKNEGKGRAIRDGFRLALRKPYDYIITIDGDNQHNPDEIQMFIDAMLSNKVDLVAGNRMHYPKGMPASRVFVNKFFSKIVSNSCKQGIPDALCGYRIIKRSVLESITLESNRFEIVPEILIKASKKGFKTMFINIECIYGNEHSSIKPWRDGYMFFNLIMKESGKH